jgi:16S rRNA U516 pseudouridylate synthase RsuA-like enzyme
MVEAEGVRLQKVLSQAGVASRRAAGVSRRSDFKMPSDVVRHSR